MERRGCKMDCKLPNIEFRIQIGNGIPFSTYSRTEYYEKLDLLKTINKSYTVNIIEH